MTSSPRDHRRFSRRISAQIQFFLVLGILATLAAILVVAINPSMRLRTSIDATRRSFSTDLQKAIVQYTIDHRGEFPEDLMILEGRDWGTDICIPGTGKHVDCVNLDDELMPDYLAGFVIDPAEHCPYKIGYFVYRAHGRPIAEPRHLGRLRGDDTERDCVDFWSWETTAASHGNGGSLDPFISGDGRFLFFDSDASNLVPGDANGVRDVFVKNVHETNITRVSVGSDGKEANDASFQASATPDGRLIAFLTDASNMIPNDENGMRDVVLRDRDAQTTELISVNMNGVSGNSISAPFASPPSLSADGRYVAFDSRASDLVPSDTNNADDVFVRDRATGTTIRISVSDAGAQGNAPSLAPSISADGRFVAFQSAATNLAEGDTNRAIDIFVHDRDPDANGVFDEPGATTTHVSVGIGGTLGNADSVAPHISGDGRYIVFASAASNLVPQDSNGLRDIFLRDRERHTTQRVSASRGDLQANGPSDSPVISRNGRYVLFDSTASNLVSGDENSARDMFLYDRRWGVIRRVSEARPGIQSAGESRGASVSDNGASAAFFGSDGIVSGDADGNLDVYFLQMRL